MRIADPFSSPTRPVLTGNRGAVSTAHPLATSAATEMLAAGGNAVDAAIAAQAILCVLSPDNCGLGGDQLCLVRDGQGEVVAVNGTGAAPRSMRTAEADGGGSVTVPGIVDAWCVMSERWGRLPLEVLLRPAIGLAEAGVILGADLARTFLEHEARLIRGGARDWAFRRGVVGARCPQPELSALLRAIGRDGQTAFYQGDIANAICAAIGRTGGDMSSRDMEEHRSVVAPPLGIAWRGRHVHVQPPVSQGVLLLMALAAEEKLGPLSAEDRDHAGIELTESTFGFRDRASEGADLLSETLTLDMNAASRRGGPRSYLHTAGVAVADSDGLVVSSLISVFDSFGSAVFVPEGGFTLNNRAAGFTRMPNDAAGGKRPIHTLAPIIVEDGSNCLALSTPGADGQVQTLLQVLSQIFIAEQDIATAIAAPRWRSQDGRLLMEECHPHRGALAAKGHDLVPTCDGDLRFGAVVCAGFINGQTVCCADWRRETWAGTR